MLKIKKKYLLIIAGIIWLIAGISILRIGIIAIISSLKTNLLWQNITLPIFFTTNPSWIFFYVPPNR